MSIIIISPLNYLIFNKHKKIIEPVKRLCHSIRICGDLVKAHLLLVVVAFIGFEFICYVFLASFTLLPTRMFLSKMEVFESDLEEGV